MQQNITLFNKKIKLPGRKICFFICTILLSATTNLAAQNALQAQLIPILEDYFPKQDITKFTCAINSKGNYVGSILFGTVLSSVVLDANYNLLYKHNYTTTANSTQFKKEYLSKNLASKINNALNVKGKNLNKGNWYYGYYLSNVNDKKYFQLYEGNKNTPVKSAKKECFYFDADGNYIGGNKVDIGTMLLQSIAETPCYQTFTSYYIQNKSTGLYMSILFKGINDNELVIQEKLGVNSQQQFQIFSPTADENVKIQNVVNNKVLSVNSPDENIIQIKSNTSEYQLFTIEPYEYKKNEYVRIRNNHSRLYISAGINNTNLKQDNVIQELYKKNDTQLWKLIPLN